MKSEISPKQDIENVPKTLSHYTSVKALTT
jgi:hypothetical protein